MHEPRGFGFEFLRAFHGAREFAGVVVEHQNEHRMEVRMSKGVSRIEVLDGPTGRRIWPDDVKARIVAESFEPGARVCDVAGKYGLLPRHLSGWRGLARKGELAASTNVARAFVPLVIEPLSDTPSVAAPSVPGAIKVEICGAILHVTPDCAPERVAALAAALRKVL